MKKPTRIEDLEAHYMAGVGVTAATLDVPIRVLSLGHASIARRGFSIGTLAVATGSSVGRIEDYVTVCLAGSAGRYLRGVALRCHMKRSLGNADLELRQLRLAWTGLEPESERAYIITVGHLGAVDSGDTQATIFRLWRRATTMLKQPRQREKHTRLAHQLLAAETMTGAEVLQLLRT